MRLHIHLEDALVAEIDRRVGPRRRSGFITGAIRRALDDEQRWELIESAVGSISSTGHEWDDDPAAWVEAQRGGDERRVG
jgi:metal-responsive CopG/Arc/MetJ family transcriptional regulator